MKDVEAEGTCIDGWNEQAERIIDTCLWKQARRLMQKARGA